MDYAVGIERWERGFKSGVIHIRDPDVDVVLIWAWIRHDCRRKASLTIQPAEGFDDDACEAYRDELTHAIGTAMLAYAKAQYE